MLLLGIEAAEAVHDHLALDGEAEGALIADAVISPAGKSFVEEPDCRAILIRVQDLQALESVPAPGPIADGLEVTRSHLVGVTAAARQSWLQWRGRLVVGVAPTLNAGPDRIRRHLREAWHPGRCAG
jgi:hypothetical protein